MGLLHLLSLLLLLTVLLHLPVSDHGEVLLLLSQLGIEATISTRSATERPSIGQEGRATKSSTSCVEGR
jgi:hypothetical protein